MKMFPMFKSEPESSYDPPPRFEKAKTGEKSTEVRLLNYAFLCVFVLRV